MALELREDPLLSFAAEVEGYILLDPCLLYSRLAENEHGAVYRANHLRLERDVVVKMRCFAPDRGEDMACFLGRAREAAAIRHPNLVQIHEVNHREGLAWVVMDFVGGESLRERVRRKGTLSVKEALTVVREVARGLAAAQKAGLTHGGVTPDNVMTSTDGDVKLLNLAMPSPQSAAELGDPAFAPRPDLRYLPPEKWRHPHRPSGVAGDMWALGALFHYMIFGRDVLQGRTVEEIRGELRQDPFLGLYSNVPGLTQDLERILRHCTAFNAEQRYRRASQLVDALERYGLDPFKYLIDASWRADTCLFIVQPIPHDTLRRARELLRPERRGKRTTQVLVMLALLIFAALAAIPALKFLNWL